MNNGINGGDIKIGVNYEVNKSSYQKLNSSFQDIKGSASKLTASCATIGKTIVSGISQAIKATVQLAKETTALYKIQMTAETKLSTVMTQRMRATDEQINKIKELASEYQNLGVIGDEVSLAGMAQLATFLKDSRSLEAILPNFANALAGMYGLDATAAQAQSLANQLGKSIANGTLSNLAKSGLTFTEVEKSAFEMADELERAEILSQALVNNYGEMSGVLSKTPLGKLKQLSNSFGDMKEKLGQAFSTIAATFVPVLSRIVEWLDRLAQKFVSISETIYTAFGGVLNNKATVGGLVGDLSELSDSYDDVSDSATEAKESLASFDNVVQLSDSGAGGGSSTSEATTEPSLSIDTQALDEAEGKFSKIHVLVEKIRAKIREWTKGVDIDKLLDFSKISENIDKIKENLTNIFYNVEPNVSAYIENIARTMILQSLRFVSVGKSIGSVIISGFSQHLDENKEKISEKLNSIISNYNTTTTKLNSISEKISKIIQGFFENPDTTTSISNIFSTVQGLSLGLVDLFSSYTSDITSGIDKIIADNELKLKEFFDNTAENCASATGLVKSVVLGLFEVIQKNYDEYFKPTLEAMTSAFSQISGAVLDMWNLYVGPTLTYFIEKIKEIWDEHLKPFVDKVLGLVGIFSKFVADIYDRVIAPVVSFVIKYIVPILSFGCDFVSAIVGGLIMDIIDGMGGLIDFLKGIFQVLDGLLTGDMSLIVEGSKNVFNGLITYVVKSFTAIVNGIIEGINFAIRTINGLMDKLPDVVKNELFGGRLQIKEINKWTPDILKDTTTTTPSAPNLTQNTINNNRNYKDTSAVDTLANQIMGQLANSGMTGNVYNIENAFGDERSMERLVSQIAATQKNMNARRGVSYA